MNIYGRLYFCGLIILDLRWEYNIYGKCLLYILSVVKIWVYLKWKF